MQTWGMVISVAGALVLAIASLQHRQLNLSIVVRSVLIWMAIGLVLFVVIGYRGEIAALLGLG